MIKILSKSFLIAYLGLTMISFTGGSETDLPLSNNTRCNTKNAVFKAGESVTYKIYYNWGIMWLSAGEVTFRVADMGDNYRLSAIGKTYSSYEWFYTVDDYFESIIDKKTLLPKKAIRNLKEGNFKYYDKMTFSQKKKVKTYRKQNNGEIVNLEFDLNDCMHDILSAVYYTRNMDFNQMNKGDKFFVKIFLDKFEWRLNVDYLGKEKKKIKDKGYYNTIKFRPQLIQNEYFDEHSSMTVWATDDKNRVPLLIESDLKVGSIKAVLKDYRGLRHEWAAKVK